MNLPAILQTVGLAGLTAAAFLLGGISWAVLIGAVGALVAGVALELQSRPADPDAAKAARRLGGS